MKIPLSSRILHLLSIAVAISTAIFAQQTTNKLAPSAERLRADVTYLASDKLEGRRTGTAGAKAAADYIAKEFARLRLEQRVIPPGSHATIKPGYLQSFPYVAGIELGNGNELMFSSVPNPNSKPVPRTSANQTGFRVGEDWMPLGLSTNAKIEKTEAVFVGYGLTVSELKHDDYAGANASGRIAIAFAGTPDGDNPHGQFARYDDVRWKAIAARNAGARALLVIANESNFEADRLSRLRYDNSAGDAGLPVVAISRQAGEVMLAADSSVLAEIEKRLKAKSTATAAEQAPKLPQYPILITLSTDLVRREADAANVIGILEGSDPSLKNEVIVIGAHYDHLGHGGAGSLAPKEGEIHHGADDNASGVAGVLELARILTSQTPRPRRSIVFAAFSGEEEGLLGSNYYVNHPVVPLANTITMINMDMIGRMKNKSLTVGGMGTATEWKSLVENANLMQGVTITATNGGGATGAPVASGMPIVVAANGQPVVNSDPAKQFTLTLNADGYGPSDHSSFYAKQVPVLFFWTGTHEDYHKPSDTADKINYEDESRILGVVGRIVQSIDASDKRPSYTLAKTEATGRSTGFRVYLGTIPNYADSNEGLLLDGVREDSPAAKAGLKAGDRIVKLAGKDIRNVYDYTYALGEMKAGEEYEVEVMRGTERLTLKLTPAARR
ncbi:MAG TPA: M20/M25/M40 family metallo-hydrolase [Pyrinomonadaceae bacterium]|nr:M20/M25/M40 family metallo-hydrolase [Pyrinomonadaceae bacterium]